LVDLMPVESNPLFAAVSPTDPYLYVTNFISGTVSVIETGGRTVVRNPMMFDSPFGVAVTTTGDYAYVTLPYSNRVAVIETTTNAVVTKIPVGAWPASVAVGPRRAYVASYGSNEVWVIDTKTHGMITAIPVAEPAFAAVAPVGGRAYVTSPGLGNVSVIDTTINQVIGNPIQVGGVPYGLAVTPNGDQVYVADLDGDEVVVIKTATNAVSRARCGTAAERAEAPGERE